MSSDPASLPELIVGLFWPSEPATQVSILLLLGFAGLAAISVYGPLLLRLFQIGRLQRAVQACFEGESSNAIQRREVANAFAESPLAYHFGDFVRRWQNAIVADPLQDASLPELSRAPVRLADVLEEHPLIPTGTRRSLLPALPAIFLSAGLLGAFAGLVLALPGIGLSLDPPSVDATSRSLQISALMDHLGMALRIGLWGLLLSLAAAITGRLIEGRADTQAEALDSWVQLAYGAISTGELATRTAHEQRAALARLQEDLAELVRQVAGRPRPLIRSTAAVPGRPPPAAAAADPEVIERAVASLGARLSEELGRSVSEQLAALRESLGSTLQGLGKQQSASAELADAVEHLTKSAEGQNAASRSLTQTAHSASDAAEEIRAGLDDFADVVSRMRETSAALNLASQRVDSTQAATNRASELLANSLEGSESAARERALEQAHEQQQQLEAIRAAVDRLGERLDELGAGVPREPAAMEASDAPAAVDSGRTPVQTPTPESSQAETIPDMKAPDIDAQGPEMIYAAREAERTVSVPGLSRGSADTEAGQHGGTLSGLLRPTHHSGPSSDEPNLARAFDPDTTLILESANQPEQTMEDDEKDADLEADDARPETNDDGASPRRGLFGRRK